MQLTYGGQTIDFYNCELPEKIVLSLSGGADSAAAMYLTAKYFPQIEIVPFCCRDINAPKDADAADAIVKWMQNQFPNNNIQDITITDFDDKSESIISWDKCDEVINNPEFNYSKLNRVQMSKIIQVDGIAKATMAKNPGAIRLDGMTRNPPDADMKALGFYNKAERRRDKAVPFKEPLKLYNKTNINNLYQIFINVDKKFVAGVYKENKLMETLFPLTRSCVGTARTTDNFTKECHKCFWCHERKWAFDLEWTD